MTNYCSIRDIRKFVSFVIPFFQNLDHSPRMLLQAFYQ